MNRWPAAVGSAVFFVLAPGVVVVGVPWLLTGWTAGEPGYPWPWRALGAALLCASALVLVRAFVRFVVEGSGTPAPVAPTKHLVSGGEYRWVRNPMYLAVVASIVGQALLLSRTVLLAYGAAVWVAMACFVRWYEEPVLRRRYGAGYDAYVRSVPRWIPRAPRRRA